MQRSKSGSDCRLGFRATGAESKDLTTRKRAGENPLAHLDLDGQELVVRENYRVDEGEPLGIILSYEDVFVYGA